MQWLAMLADPFCSAHSLESSLLRALASNGMVARGSRSQVPYPISADGPRHRTLPVCVDYHQSVHPNG
jgi:hypothetical protein